MLSILVCYKLEKGTIKTALSKKQKTRMTKEDERRMHMSRSAMCSIQTVKYLHIPHTPRAPALRPHFMLVVLQE